MRVRISGSRVVEERAGVCGVSNCTLAWLVRAFFNEYLAGRAETIEQMQIW